MKTPIQKWFKRFIVLLMVLGLTACGGGSSDSGAEVVEQKNIAGNWIGSAELNNQTFTIELEIIQSGNSLTVNTYSPTDKASFTYSGLLTGDKIDLVSVATNGTRREYNLTLTSDATASGIFTFAAPGGNPISGPVSINRA